MNSVETVLLENIDNPKSLFIFPTDVAASRWADHLLRLRGGTVAMNKFIAWDTFKQNSIRSKVQNRKSIPSALRKIFTSRLIMENEQACAQGRAPVFLSLIRVEWAGQAAQFAGWLTELLPQLGAWLRKAAGFEPALLVSSGDTVQPAKNFDADDRDLLVLARRYAQFLDEQGLFEPAWETPPFEENGKECFIFFPQSLSDYSEYRDLLSASGNVKTIDAGAEKPDCDVFFYDNSRSEIAEAALYIRALHESEGIGWDSIVVSIPDAENYEPYVLREFTNRNIPFVRRVGKPLDSYQAGKLFRAILDCASRDFAFSEVIALILNSNLPWKDTAEIKKLVDFGIRNNCISSWVEEVNGKEKKINAWEEAFAHPFGGFDPAVRDFFTDLIKRVLALRGAASFTELRKQYFIFRERFFDMENCTPETDLILSRCVSELMYLCGIEKDFPGVQAPDPFMFFTEYLGEVNYLAQQPVSGVTILPYKTAACAPFECHIILGATQQALSAVFSRLRFLSRKKREKLGLADEDSSAAFIDLHKFNSMKNAAFFCSEQTFSGYAIPHSKLAAPSKPKTSYAQEKEFVGKFTEDYFRGETGFILSVNSGKKPTLTKLHGNQSRGFEEWRSRRKTSAESKKNIPGGKTAGNLFNLIRTKYAVNPQFPGKYRVSASSLEPYYICSLKWLFERVLALENVQIETSLMAENIIGMVYHEALNLFFSELKKTGDVLCCHDNRALLPGTYRELLIRSVDTLFSGFPLLPSGDKSRMSSLTARLLTAEKKHIQYQLEKCLTAFLPYFAGCRVTGSEVSYQAERDSYYLDGKLDCILEDSRDESQTRGKLIIVDFKLKSLPARNDCIGEGENGLANFQLPMYISLTEETGKNEVHTALFFSIIEQKPEVVFGAIEEAGTKTIIPKKEEDRILRNSEGFEHIMTEFKDKAARFVCDIKNENFSVFNPEFKVCSVCKFHRICRTVYRIDCDNEPAWRSLNETH